MSVNHRTKTLQELLHGRIDAAGGVISFEKFMQTALYEPELGYYESGEIFGAGGDFVTGPDLGPWLALGFADLILWGREKLGSPAGWTLLEQGGGSGRLLVSILDILGQKEALPSRIISVEKSDRLKAAQQALYQEHGYSVEQHSSLESLQPMENIIAFSNELPDAFPVRCLIKRGDELFERGVASDGTNFIWKDMPWQGEGFDVDKVLVEAWPDGYVSEWNPHLELWQKSLSHLVGNGYAFCVDYGYTQQEYYRPQRMSGTLMGHKGHQVIEDVLNDPGSCDLTAHIDFTSVVRAGMKSGLQGSCFMSQGGWLAQSPLVQEEVQKLALAGTAESVSALAHAKRMMLPFGMGETFKLLIQGKGMPVEKPLYLSAFDHFSDLHLPDRGA